MIAEWPTTRCRCEQRPSRTERQPPCRWPPSSPRRWFAPTATPPRSRGFTPSRFLRLGLGGFGPGRALAVAPLQSQLRHRARGRFGHQGLQSFEQFQCPAYAQKSGQLRGHRPGFQSLYRALRHSRPFCQRRLGEVLRPPRLFSIHRPCAPIRHVRSSSARFQRSWTRLDAPKIRYREQQSSMIHFNKFVDVPNASPAMKGSNGCVHRR